MARKIEVLLITPECPYPPDDGHKLRVYNILKYFSDQYTFDLISGGSKYTKLDSALVLNNLVPYIRNYKYIHKANLKRLVLKTTYEKIRNILSPFELSLDSAFYSAEMCQIVNQEISNNKYDIILFCGYSTFLYYDSKNDQTPYVVDIVDSMSLYLKNEMKINNKIFKSFLNYIWAINYEKKHFSKAKNIIMISAKDASYVKKNCPNSNVWVVPNGVDTDYFKSDDNQLPSDNTLVFTGVMDYPPNNEAVIHFIKEVLPLVRSKISNVSLIVAGRNPTDELKDVARDAKGVILTGYVEDIRPYFQKSTVYIAPIISGAGLKNKILEAWAMSKPVVATRLSCEGINDAINGKNIIIAKDVNEFAQGILRLLSDSSLRDKLAMNGRLTVEKSYSWKNGSRMIEEIFTTVLKSK